MCRMQALNSSSNESENDLGEVIEDYGEKEEPELPRRRLNEKWISVPQLVYEDEENLDDDIVEPTANYNDKVGEKRQREKKDESAQTKKKKKKKNQDSVDNSAEMKEMWDSITNDKVCVLVFLFLCSVFLRSEV